MSKSILTQIYKSDLTKEEKLKVFEIFKENETAKSFIKALNDLEEIIETKQLYNAEYHKNYYKKNKEKLIKQCLERYYNNKDEIKKKSLERYYAKKELNKL